MSERDVAAVLSEVDPSSRGSLAAFGRSALPLVAPGSEAEAVAALRAALARGLVVAPAGRGSKLPGEAAPPRVDLVLSARRLVGLSAYEPAEGVLSARAGTTVESIAARLAADGVRLAPDVARPDAVSLGGAFASAQGGADRLKRGTFRDSILGARVLGADGQITQSGGRLVKNVTGYDLFRLHGGARGALGLVLELSLRLWTDPPTTLWLERAEPDPRAGLLALWELHRQGLGATRLVLWQDQGGWSSAVHLEGRPRALEALARAAQRFAETAPGELRTYRGEDARRRAREVRDLVAAERRPDGLCWPLLTLHCLPSRAPALFDRLLTAGPLGARGRWIAEPAIARFFLCAPMPQDTDALLALRAALTGPDIEARWWGIPPSIQAALGAEAPAGAEAMARILESFDPEGRWARVAQTKTP